MLSKFKKIALAAALITCANSAFAVALGTQSSVFISRQADAMFVPEPSSLAFIGLGLLGAGFMSRRKKA